MSNNDDADIPMTDTPPQHDRHSEHAADSGGEDVPAMVVTRERRQNAGNRMSKLLALAQEEGAEPEEEQYADIFQEAADDVEFEGEEGDEQDFNMDSSSEDEAEGEGDEDQGEKELKKELRTQSKKRKRDSLLQHATKRAATRIAPVPLGASQPPPPPADRPKKKSERVSWLPEQKINPVRSSRRSLAVQNKQEINDRLKEKEKHRLKTVEVMRAAEARKEAAKPKVLTQEERLKEAALIEKRNSKSLNRWETNEKRRAAEQAERLAALKNRKLEGPIITYWSGQSTWVDGKLKRVGRAQQTPVQEPVQEKPKPAVTVKKDDIQPMKIEQPLPDNEASLEMPSTPAPLIREPASASPSDQFITTSPATQTPAEPSLAESLSPVALPISTPSLPKSDTQTDSPSSPQGMGSFLDGIHMYAGLSPEQQKSPPNPSLQSQLQASSQITHPPAAPARPPKPPPGPPSTATRNLIVLSDFDETTSGGRGKDIESLRSQLFGWSTTTSTTANSTSVNSGTGSKKLQPTKKSLCAITGQEAKYRDPVTGLGYVDAYALKRIRKVVRGEMRWSGVLGVFIGETNGRVARGVPPGF
ncbi:YL1-domain-containing protein [Venturia nashicola]|uniref:YL1-domain-containing protein n=1 Tax=Venturia nashicola TaxID=86259 RepID=A0A4Z1P0D7_9PEZI|nr:YL1-domain-containing protein [Venturia nashicola]TLD20857.1 YL1-domain-containing protein [Venturia nashicola]